MKKSGGVKAEISAKDISAEREDLIHYLESQLIGPHNGRDETLLKKDKPYERYLMGALFPAGAGARMPDEDDSGDTGGADDDDDPISLAYQIRPASMGISFCTQADSVIVGISGAQYTKDGDHWKRQEFGSREKPLIAMISCSVPEVDTVGGLDARLTSVWRRQHAEWLVTIVLVNKKIAHGGKFNADDLLYQVSLACTPDGQPVEAYPTPGRCSWDEEEEELALLYRNKSTFAIGHGTSASWNPVQHGKTASVETTFLPRYEVPPVTAELDHNDLLSRSSAFSLQFLARDDVAAKEKIRELSKLRGAYGTWVADQAVLAETLDEFRAAPTRLLARMQDAIKRMDKGLRLLERDPNVMRCFVVANRAMHMQMVHSTSEKYARIIKSKGTAFDEPDYDSTAWSGFRWRPFQLAFQLMVIESIANQNSTERDIVDLIWFPTGGGKTEAYLAVAAFELFYRRIKYGDEGGGTAVIKRYTLRLLTAQQFERVSSLICACEVIRQKYTKEFGAETFSLGLWVGEDSSPNTFQVACDKFNELITQNRPENPFQLQKCPWCGTRIIPKQRDADLTAYGVRCDQTSFELFCPETTCRFHVQLPINVVDDHLYSHPPSFLVGTIDKFARLAWTERPRAFFAGIANGGRMPPSLIIQDELHLISGPLGTIAGLYEAAMDVVMQSLNARPKYIAATATIRRSREQCQRIYSRGVSIFPPSGLSSQDSYFAREQPVSAKSPGRLYIGVMGQYHSPVTSLVQTSAALSQAPVELALSKDAMDGYWTQVIFHNSKRELGKTMTLCRDDIPKRAAVICSSDDSLRKSFMPVEMSANIPSREIPVVLEGLKNAQWESGVIDILPCTNMFSVGVDVGRLGLIVMNGQPKTTAEYIQASSRVGRDKVPGLVVAFYPNNKARDRSHYESFISYHQALYRAVEPTSVTPYSLPSMERALHAALVITMRYCGGLLREEDAGKFNPVEHQQKQVIEKLRCRMKSAQSGDAMLTAGIDTYLNKCIEIWATAAKRSREGANRLRYDARNAANFEALLVQYKPGINWKPEIPWATLNSMRNVDQECRVHVRGES